jgi:hypothetical protein
MRGIYFSGDRALYKYVDVYKVLKRGDTSMVIGEPA